MTKLEIDLEQGSEQWKEYRSTRLGASEISAVLGLSPYMTAFELWQLKTKRKPPIVANFAMQKGIRLEPVARKMVEERFKLDLTPKVFTDDELPFLVASLDGFDEESKINWETKCPGKEEHYNTHKGPPEKYYYQVQQQMMLSGAEKTLFTTFFEDAPKEYKIQHCWVEPDPAAFELIRLKAKEFWRHVEDDTPPKLSDRDWFFEKDPIYARSCTEYIKLCQEKKEIEATLADIKMYLIDNAKHPKVISGPLKIQRIKSKGRVDYNKIESLKGVNLDGYRGTEITSWKVTPIK